MKKNLKRVLSVVLCIVLICGCFVNICPHAKASAVAAWAATDVTFYVMAFVLGLLGIHFATKGEMMQAANQFLLEKPIIKAYLLDHFTNPTDSLFSFDSVTMKAQLYLGGFKWIKQTLIPEVQSYFSRDASAINIPIDLGIKYNYLGYPVYASVDNVRPNYIDTTYKNGVSVLLNINDIEYLYQPHTFIDEYGNHAFEMLVNGTPMFASLVAFETNANTEYSYGWSFYISSPVTSSGYYALYCVCAIQGKNMSTGALTSYSSGVFNRGDHPESLSGYLVINSADLGNFVEQAPYGYDIDYSNSEFMAALQKIIDQMTLDNTAPIDIPYDGPVEDVREGKKEVEEDLDGLPYIPDWALWWEKLGIKDLIDSLSQSKVITESDFDTKGTQLPVDIKDKFPFCVPFDLIALVTALNAPAVVPSATIPMKFSALGYDSSMTINLGQFEGVAKALRWGTTLLFLFGLIVLTRKLIKG